MITILLLLAVASTPVASIDIEPDPTPPEVPAFSADPSAETLHLDQHDHQRFSLICTAPDADAELEIAWRAVSLETGGSVADHESSGEAVIQGTWALTFVTRGAHLVEAVCYDPATEWTEQASWIVHVEPGAQRAAV